MVTEFVLSWLRADPVLFIACWISAGILFLEIVRVVSDYNVPEPEENPVDFLLYVAAVLAFPIFIPVAAFFVLVYFVVFLMS